MSNLSESKNNCREKKLKLYCAIVFTYPGASKISSGLNAFVDLKRTSLFTTEFLRNKVGSYLHELPCLEFLKNFVCNKGYKVYYSFCELFGAF